MSEAPTDEAPEDLDERISAALERVGQAMGVQLWDAAKRHRITPTQLQVLLRLATDPPQLRRIGALAGQLDVTHPTVSDAVSALERKGLVEREGPGRRAPLALSARGHEVAGELASWDARTRTALSQLSDAEKEGALRLLLELIAGLQREGAITVARMCSTCRFFQPDRHPGERQRHHCGLLDMPLADSELRVDCPEHELEAA